ncbi:unnamed protein product [Spirodela intermedia]|uniref:Reverse transcriptase Ty1/copia-type domain-containing protein n=1 Tax=Spirodela intermedia TaxID=51605 RepID=A0A7I8IJF6_SPIIN|nr:unnamed protein product [Spirodela intermedia]CAA6658019.1 unnamed protein product [Spirodela intermedia]
MEAIDQNQTWELVTPPADYKLIGLKWIFMLKKNAQGEVLRHKARLVVKVHLIIGVYVDDFIVTRETDSNINNFKEKMKHFFKMSDLRYLCSYLGIKVVQNEAYITLSQRTYVLKVLNFVKMDECNLVQAPLEARVKFDALNLGTSVDSTYFRSLIGSL